MPDITMCKDQKCPMRMECYRFMANPDPYWQAYFHGSPSCFGTKDGCEYFWQKDDGDETGI